MSDRRPYSRVYWEVMDDEKFDGVREDVRLFGSWSLLLVVADMAWPSPAFVPPTVPKAALAVLSERGLVDLMPGHRFKLRGLAAERTRRSDSARNAAALRWQREGNAETMPRRGRDEAEQSQAEQTREENDVVHDYYRMTARFPNETIKGWLERLSNEFGYDATSRKLGAEYLADTSLRTLLGRVENGLKSDVHLTSKKAAEAEKTRLEEWNASRKVSPEQAAINQARIREIQEQWFKKEPAA